MFEGMTLEPISQQIQHNPPEQISCNDLKVSMFLMWGVFLTREFKNPMGKFNFFRLQQLLSRDNITNLG